MAIAIQPDSMIPDLLGKHPYMRPVLDKYGLRGCGGEHGPHESLQFFAETHGVPLKQLLSELSQANPEDVDQEEAKPLWVDVAYRYFFGAGIAVALLAGATVGTWLMFSMGQGESYFAPGIHKMNAHANAMIFGFIGCFVLGFGYQALPRFKHTSLRHGRLAFLSFVLLVAGVGLRFFGEFFGHDQVGGVLVAHTPAVVAAVVGSLAEVAAFGLFGFIIYRTNQASGKPSEVYDQFVYHAAFWYIISGILSTALYIAVASAETFGDVVARVSAFQDPLRNIQLFGAIALIIFGVMLRLLPPAFGFHAPSKKMFRVLLATVNVGLVLMVVAFPLSVAARKGWIDAPNMTSALRGGYALGALILVGSFIWMIAAFRPWRRSSLNDRSTKFLRAAFLWGSVSLFMLLLEPVYIVMMGGFGHGYHGGMRHAFTLGFIVMTVVAVSSKVVPTLNGHDPNKLSRLYSVFWALNLAIVVRVAVEVASDFDPALLKWLAPSGVLVILGLGIWAFHLVSLVVKAGGDDESEPLTPETLNPSSKVARIIEQWPQTLPAFKQFGFGLLANPVARRTLARGVTVQTACGMHNVNPTDLLAAIRTSISGQSTTQDRIDAESIVVETAEKYPATVPVFAELNMDTCCNGGKSIAEAAKQHDYPLEEVLERLNLVVQGEPV